MRIAILSDIHSNLEALTEALLLVDREKPDRVVCLGDVVGYGASVNECCRLIRARCEVTLLGNHDAAVSGRMDYSFYYDAARHALDGRADRRRHPRVVDRGDRGDRRDRSRDADDRREHGREHGREHRRREHG